MQTKLRKIGNSTGVVIPKKVLGAMNIKEGDEVFITECEDGIKLSQYDPEFSEQMTLVRQVMKKRKNALRELSK